MPASLAVHALAAWVATSVPAPAAAAPARAPAPPATRNPPAVVIVPLLGPVVLPLTLPTEVRVRRAPARPARPVTTAPERPAPPREDAP
jgi:hypothetical protein